MRTQPLNDFEPVSTNDAEQLINKGKTLSSPQPLLPNTGRHTGRSVEIRPYKFLIRKFCKVSKIICDPDEQDTSLPRGICRSTTHRSDARRRRRKYVGWTRRRALTFAQGSVAHRLTAVR